MNEFESFNEDFCVALEYYLTGMFNKITDESSRGFCCDGVLMPSDSNQISKKRINDSRKIETIAWTGVGGQNRFKLIIHFGKYSLRRYAKGKDLDDCLCESNSNNIKIDIVSKQIEIYLK
jgi:hypothetical protein